MGEGDGDLILARNGDEGSWGERVKKGGSGGTGMGEERMGFG